jgi:hypothetical protein
MPLLTGKTEAAAVTISTGITKGVAANLTAVSTTPTTRGLILKAQYSVDGTTWSDPSVVSLFEVVAPNPSGTAVGYVEVNCPGATQCKLIVRNLDDASITYTLATRAF